MARSYGPMQVVEHDQALLAEASRTMDDIDNMLMALAERRKVVLSDLERLAEMLAANRAAYAAARKYMRAAHHIAAEMAKGKDE